VRRSPFSALAALALLATIAFLLVPVVAVFADVGPGRLLEALGEESAREALRLSLWTTLLAVLIVVAVGTPAAYLLARCERLPGRLLILTVASPPPAASASVT
jgi:molybdate transport system permease protein